MLTSTFDVLPQALDAFRNPACSLSLHPCESGSCDAQLRPCVWTRLVDLYGGQLNVKTSQLAIRAQRKIQSENTINGSCHFSKGCLIRIKFCGIFQIACFEMTKPSLIQNYCLNHLLRTCLSLPSPASADIRYFCKSALGHTWQGPGK